MFKLRLLLVGLWMASLLGLASEGLANKLYTVRTWTLTDGKTMTGRFEDVKDDAIALVISGTPKLVPFVELSYADQVFLRDALANTTRPLQLTLAPPPPFPSAVVVARPVVKPPPISNPDTEPQRTYHRPPEEKPKQVNYGQSAAVMVGEGILALAIIWAVLRMVYR